MTQTTILSLLFGGALLLCSPSVRGEPPVQELSPAKTNSPSPPTEGIILFESGDSLPIVLSSKQTDSSWLEATSPLLDGKALFDIKKIVAIQFPNEEASIGQNVTIQMTNGDIIRGKLKKAFDKTLEVETSWSGALPVQRSMVDSLSFCPPDRIILDGSKGAQAWSNAVKRSRWQIDNNSFSSRGRGMVSAEADLPDKLRLSFQFSCERYAQLAIGLWSDNIKEEYPPNVYILNIYSSTVQLQRRKKGGTVSYQSSKVPLLDMDAETSGNFRVDLFCDKESETFLLYVNGTPQASWNKNSEFNSDDEEGGAEEEDDDSPTEKKDNNDARDKSQFGKGVYFSNRAQGNNLNISDVKVTRWNGAYPGEILLDVPKSIRSKAAPLLRTNRDKDKPSPKEKEGDALTDRIQLANGDFISAGISSASDQNLSVKAPGYELDIPIARILGADIHHTVERKQRLSREDVKLHLADGSLITARLKNATPDTLEMSSESLGTFRIKLSSVRNIRFNLYGAPRKKQQTESTPPPVQGTGTPP